MATKLINKIIITFRDNKNNHIVSPTQLSQYWSDLGAEIVPDAKLEIAIGIGTFLAAKDERIFQSKFADVVRLRTSDRDVLGLLCYPINAFDNKIDESKLNDIINLKYTS